MNDRINEPLARPRSQTLHIAHGILERDGRILLVASKYPNQPAPLWNLPGGRQRTGELLDETVRREFLEETGLFCEVLGFRYVSESFDPASDLHVTSFVFGVSSQGTVHAGDDAHVVDVAWVPIDELRRRIAADVVREPLLAHLVDPSRRYFARANAGITIEFVDDP